VLGIKPSPARWELWGEMERANALIKAFTEEDDRLVFVETAPPLLGPDGAPRPELYVQDGIHFSPEGYAIWTSLLEPLLAAS